jgi:hypothetical protein
MKDSKPLPLDEAALAEVTGGVGWPSPQPDTFAEGDWTMSSGSGQPPGGTSQDGDETVTEAIPVRLQS